MYFVTLTFLVFLVLSLLGYLMHTQSQIASSHRTNGPRAISEWIEQRNRTGLLILVAILAVVAFLEVLFPEFAYRIQDAQVLLGGGLPEWGIVFFRGGSISWGFYLAIFLGFALGQAGGTLLGCRRYARTRSFGMGEVL